MIRRTLLSVAASLVLSLSHPVAAATFGIVEFGPDRAEPNRVYGVAFEGTIEPGDAERFTAYLEERKNVRSKDSAAPAPSVGSQIPIVFIMNSLGGDVDEAMKIGRIIRSRGYVTWLIGDCLSACPLVFLGGVQRHFDAGRDGNSRGARIGVHRPELVFRSDDLVGEERKRDALKYRMFSYVSEMGATPNFVLKMHEVRNKDLEYIGPTELALWRVITSLESPSAVKHLEP